MHCGTPKARAASCHSERSRGICCSSDSFAPPGRARDPSTSLRMTGKRRSQFRSHPRSRRLSDLQKLGKFTFRRLRFPASPNAEGDTTNDGSAPFVIPSAVEESVAVRIRSASKIKSERSFDFAQDDKKEPGAGPVHSSLAKVLRSSGSGLVHLSPPSISRAAECRACRGNRRWRASSGVHPVLINWR